MQLLLREVMQVTT